MPFINSKISTSVSAEQEQALKTRLGQAISIVPGKSENWLMLGFEPNYNLYFRGDNSEPLAMVDVSVFGDEDAAASDRRDLQDLRRSHGHRAGSRLREVPDRKILGLEQRQYLTLSQPHILKSLSSAGSPA